VPDEEAILDAEESGDGSSNLMGKKLALAAQSFPHCQPLSGSHIRLGWYDSPKPNRMDVCAIHPPEFANY
jgi:hypothetical protein